MRQFEIEPNTDEIETVEDAAGLIPKSDPLFDEAEIGDEGDIQFCRLGVVWPYTIKSISRADRVVILEAKTEKGLVEVVCESILPHH